MNKDFHTIPENIDSIDWVKTKLNHMYEVDQYMRNYWNTSTIQLDFEKFGLQS